METKSILARLAIGWLVLNVSLALAAPANEAAGLPREALELLRQLPGQKLTPEAVLLRARDSSDSYRSIESLLLSAESFELRAASAFRPRLQLSFVHGLDEQEPLTPFEPQSFRTTALRAGVLQAFPTGTELDLSVLFDSTTLTLLPEFGPPRIDTREARAHLEIRQNLLKNAFGKSDRLGLRAARFSSEAQDQQRRSESEDWALNLVRQFYLAWLSQNRVRLEHEYQDRRRALLRVTRIIFARGTAERPDLLSAESNLLEVGNRLRNVREDLFRRWKALAISLKLPAALQSVDPTLIPLALDDRHHEALRLCAAPAAGASGAMGLARAQASRAELQLRQARSLHKPALNFRATLGANGVNQDFATALGEATGIDHPSWEVALDFELPIGLTESRAALLEAQTAAIRTDAAAVLQQDRERTEWVTTCSDLKRRIASREVLEQIVRKQRERIRLEQQRFRIGKVRLTDVTRAEDEGSVAELALLNEEIQLRLSAWELFRLAGRIPELVEELE